ncbi:MAG: hypothetical protein ACK58L_01145, partial [Planctomycetota bacterium]
MAWPSIINTERLETRVLLSATSDPGVYTDLLSTSTGGLSQATSAFGTSAGATAAFSMTASDYLAAAAQSPIGSNIAQFEPYYSQFGGQADSGLEQSVVDAVSQQDSQIQVTTSGTEASNQQDQQQITAASQNVLLRLMGVHRDGPSASDSVQAGASSMFQNSSNTASLNALLPMLQQESSLFLVVPDGETSFYNVTVISPESTPATTNADVSAVTTISLQQNDTSPTDWSVSQSWSTSQSALESASYSGAAPSGEDSGTGNSPDEITLEPTVTSSESYAVTVINGTTTVRTWSKSGSISLRLGSMGTEPGSVKEPWTVPDTWVAAAAGSVNGQSAGGSFNTSLNIGTTDSEANSFGLAFSATGTISLTLTEVLVTMADGTPGTKRTMDLTWSGSVHFGIEGSYSFGLDDLQDSLPDDATPLPTGMTVDVGGSWQLWAKASVAATATASVTVPNGGLLSFLGTDFEGSLRLGASAAAGGAFNSHEKLTLDEASGSSGDGTDEFERVDINNSTRASGIVGLEFWAVASTADLLGTGSNSDSPETGGLPGEGSSSSEPGNNPRSSANPADDTPVTIVASNSGIGTRSASTLTDGKESGIQVAFELNGSWQTTKDENFGSKDRSELLSPAVNYRTVVEQHSTEISKSSGDLHFVVALGTERKAIGFSVNISDTENSTEDIDVLETWSPGETPPTSHEVLYGVKRHRGEDESKSSFSFGVALGADATGAPGDALHYKSEGSGFSEGDVTFVARVVNYLDSSGDVYPWVERDFERHQWNFVSGLGIETVAEAGTAELADYSEVGTQTLPVVPTVVLFNVQTGGEDLERLLNEYRDRSTKVARLQAQLAVTTDPGLQSYFQGLIATEQAILADIAAAALAAGATQTQLDQIAQEAQAAAQNDPIDLQTLDNFNDVYDDSAAPGYFYFLFNPSAMDDDLEYGFYGFMGAGGALLATAGALAAWPVVAGFASAEFSFVLPGATWTLAGEASLFTGASSTVYTITGAEVLAAGAIVSGTTTMAVLRVVDIRKLQYPSSRP